MNLVICMAGRNTRFHDVGIDIPKYLLPVSGIPVIELIIRNLVSSNLFTNVFLVAHQRDVYFREELELTLKSLCLNAENLIYIGETKGQAETANISIDILNLNISEPIVFHNADTILFGRDIARLSDTLEKGHGSIDVFMAESSSYSYVKIANNKILEIVEKHVISKWATSGLYGFPSASTFQDYYKKHSELVKQNESSELYISNVINLMLADNWIFEPLSNDESDLSPTLVIGSPAEYRLIQSSKIMPNHVI